MPTNGEDDDAITFAEQHPRTKLGRVSQGGQFVASASTGTVKTDGDGPMAVGQLEAGVHERQEERVLLGLEKLASSRSCIIWGSQSFGIPTPSGVGYKYEG